jgi:hypothetical protein
MKNIRVTQFACLAAMLLLAKGQAAAQRGGAQVPTARSAGADSPTCAPYCSLSAVNPFYGDVSSSGGLRAALAARTFKRQLILMPSDAHRLEAALAGVASLRRLGLGHVLFVSTDPLTCRAVGGRLGRMGLGRAGARQAGARGAQPAAGARCSHLWLGVAWNGPCGRPPPQPPRTHPLQVEKLEPSLGCVWQERRAEPPEWTPLTRLYVAKERLTLRCAAARAYARSGLKPPLPAGAGLDSLPGSSADLRGPHLPASAPAMRPAPHKAPTARPSQTPQRGAAGL